MAKAKIKIQSKLVDKLQFLSQYQNLLQQLPMSRNINLFRNQDRNLNSQPNEDQNKPKNVANLKAKKDQMFQMIKIPLPTLRSQQTPLTTYRAEPTSEEKEDRKWKYLTKFQELSSRAHYIHELKYQTLFLSYSLAQKTVDLIGDTLSFSYWAVCCMFLAMKYEEIYPPRLKDLRVLVKHEIKPEEYCDAELKIFEHVGLDLNFISLNTMLSEYIHAVNQTQKYFIFYLLQIALSERSVLRKFTLKELILSVIFIMTSHRLQFYSQQKIDGIKFERIEECSKFIIINQSRATERHHFLVKKYKTERAKMVACGSIPIVQNLTSLIFNKLGKEEMTPKIIGFCKDPNEEIDEQNIVSKINSRYQNKDKKVSKY